MGKRGVHVKINNCTIIPTTMKERADNITCATCMHVNDGRYQACLDIAAEKRWGGWKHISGEQCDNLTLAIRRKQAMEYDYS